MSGGGDCRVVVWDMDSGNEIRALTGHTQEIVSKKRPLSHFSPNSDTACCPTVQLCVQYDERIIASSSADSSIRIWDLRGK